MPIYQSKIKDTSICVGKAGDSTVADELRIIELFQLTQWRSSFLAHQGHGGLHGLPVNLPLPVPLRLSFDRRFLLLACTAAVEMAGGHLPYRHTAAEAPRGAL